MKSELGTLRSQIASLPRGPSLKSQIATSSFSHGGRRKLPVAFTEQRFSKSATAGAHGSVLTPGRHVGAEEVEDEGEPFEDKTQCVGELHGEFAEPAELEKTIKANLKGLGHGG